MKVIHKTLDLTGAAGSASATVSTHVNMMRLVAAEVVRGSQPATLDVTVSNGARTLLTLTNVNADRLVQLKLPVQDGTGTDVAGDLEHPWVNCEVTVAAAQGNAGALTVRLVFE